MRVVTRAEVEAAAASGASLAIDATTLVTPLARDRATVLGVSLEETTGDAGYIGEPDNKPSVHRLVKQSQVRTIARRTLLQSGRGLAGLDDLVEQVMRRVEDNCGCEGKS